MKLILLTILIFPITVAAQLQLAKIFTDHVVLQRNQPITIFGQATAAKTVTVHFNKEVKTAIANEEGYWQMEFKSQPQNTIPQTITVTCDTQKIVVKNILIGDVWLCIGQSNMEFPMEKEIHFPEAKLTGKQPLLRFFNPVYAGKNTYKIAFTDSIRQRLTPQHFYKGEWQCSDSNSLRTMSAVAYYFGKKILEAEQIPIGLINLSIGGAPLETFISANALKNSKQFSAKMNGNWLMNDALPVWVRQRREQNVGDLKNVPTDLYGPNHAFKPAFAYEAGIKPIIHFPVKGILCYQGESNAQEPERVNEYALLSKLMVDDFRKERNQPALPFYFVQISSIDTLQYNSHLWPMFRDEQRKILSLVSNSGMAVSSDFGSRNDVHPTNKKVVGERLAAWALHKTYHKHVVPSGPLPIQAKYRNKKIIITFQYSAGGLATAVNEPLRGFSLDGIQEASARIQKNKIIIPALTKPGFIYYGWQPFTRANLVNAEKLPASTFKIHVL